MAKLASIMAGTSKFQKRHVPVSSRDARPAAKRRSIPRPRMGVTEFAVIAGVAVIVLLTIYVPLKNYFAGRAEIAQLHDSIAAKQVQKQDVEKQLDQYNDDNFVREQARRRLGVVPQGETAYRIVDPNMTTPDQTTTSTSDHDQKKSWYDLLWNSVSNPDVK